jgi:hypothetical protein
MALQLMVLQVCECSFKFLNQIAQQEVVDSNLSTEE